MTPSSHTTATPSTATPSTATPSRDTASPQQANGNGAAVEFWFEFGSNYSYLSVMCIEPLAARHGVKVLWRAFLLGPVFKALGWQDSPFVVQPVKGAYALMDTARHCERLGLPWKTPSVFPRRALLPMRVAMLGAGEPWMGAFCRRIMQMNFGEDRDIDTPEAVTEALDELGLPAAGLIAQAQSEPNKTALREQTEEALRRGIFGAPTFFAGEQMYWGNDRMEDALSCAAMTYYGKAG
ncbi:2-hydroxychromene-2-carboxylate isomerase [Cupriavidus sp. AU9028]|uniref:2-hydroxychromene-2-carboxylate isomerase n=1 Tax=Cupriavidus sp. AU9028 TaxID=2871157 RepID=UPI001C969CCE|nr:2-hydroxychromene-2-carboxylate isomerase [Cupriavidus sp. AU9028]MBY4896832.1 2-hydroxychromene-2-carboxylate isomerase [Cupriavidus sp. AU9028]